MRDDARANLGDRRPARRLVPPAPRFPFAVIHRDDAPDGTGCGQLAFRMRNRLALGEVFVAADVQWPDGSPARVDELLRCGFCHRVVRPTLEHLRWQDESS